MSLYRTLIAVVAAMGLATAAIAADENTNAQSNAESTQAIQVADASSSSSQASTEQTKVNINTATAKELMQVKGLNAAKAKAIVSFRKKHGDFKNLDDLKQVKGFKKMNEKTMKDIQDQLTLG